MAADDGFDEADDDAERWEEWLEAEDDRSGDDALDLVETPYDDEAFVDEDDGEDDDAIPPPGPPAQAFGTPPCTVIARQGDCALSIARTFRISVEQLWSAPENAALRKKREPNQLLPGDALFVPMPKARAVEAQTGRLHRFQVTRPICTVTFRFLEGGRPRAGVEYRFEIDGVTKTGQTDGDGRIVQRAPRDARRGTITLFGPKREEVYPVRLGHLDPVDEIAGVQERLTHLGHCCAPIDGKESPRLRAALLAFQRAHGLPATGEIDPTTRDALKEAHGS